MTNVVLTLLLRRSSALTSRPQSNGHNSSPEVTVTAPGSNTSKSLQQPTEVVLQRLQEALSDSRERGTQQLRLDRSFVEAIVKAMISRNEEYEELKRSYDGIRVRIQSVSRTFSLADSMYSGKASKPWTG